MTDFEAVLGELTSHHVSFIVIGGLAAIVHGSAHYTQDVDIVYQRSTENLDRLIAALAGSHPYLRGAPPGLPFTWNRATLHHGLNYTLTTSLGLVDVLGEIPGGGRYEDLAPGAKTVELFGSKCLCMTLDQLIRSKRAAGRPKDLQVLAELEAIRDEQQKP
ncbi:MAG TPA: hypothetical protein VGL53_00625 [Bryobacteraceae bacterium]|jgi:predicted nucleotidyltransferase